MRLHKDEDDKLLKYDASIIQYLPIKKIGNSIQQPAIMGDIGLIGSVTESQLNAGIKPKDIVDLLSEYYEMLKDINTIVAVTSYNEQYIRIVVFLHLDLKKLPIKTNSYGVYQNIPVSDVVNVPEIKKILQIIEYYGFTAYNLSPDSGLLATFPDFANTSVPVDIIFRCYEYHLKVYYIVIFKGNYSPYNRGN